MDLKKRIFWIILLVGLIFSQGAWAGEVLVTRISIAGSPAAIVYDQARQVMDQKVYEALSIVVVDQNDNKIEFSQEDIKLKYNNAIGRQTVEVNYSGNENYKESVVSGQILITQPGKKNTRLILKANPPAVGFVADPAVLEKELFDDLAIDVVDEDGNKVSFSRSEIELIFDHNIGSQAVAVNYSGNNTYNGAQALGRVEITGKKETRISVNTSPAEIKFSDDPVDLDTKVYECLAVLVTDVNNKKIDFNRNDIAISYNRAVGDQDVTIKYKGNEQFGESKKTAFIKISGKENTLVALSQAPLPIQYNEDPLLLDAAVLAELKVRILDSNNNEINFKAEEIEISYNHEAGDQEVTIKYRGNDQYYQSLGNQKIIIVRPLQTALVMAANPSQVNFDPDLKKLDQAVYDDLVITIRDVDNKEVSFTPNDIELVYDREIGDQQVLVKYRGNDSYKKTEATAQVKIVKSKQVGIMGMEIIIAIGVLLLAGIGYLTYRLKKQK